MLHLKYIFNEYVIQPLYLNSGYNIVNTTIYIIVFMVALFLIYKELFLKKRIILSNEFLVSLSGWMVLGGVLRVMKDAGIIHSLIFVTPFIYILMFVSVLVVYFIMKFARKKGVIKSEERALLYTGWALVLISMSFLKIKNILGMSYALGLWGVMGLFFYIISRKVRLLDDAWNFFALQAQLLDACGSSVGITYYGFWEKHVLGRTLIKFLEDRRYFLINGSAAWVMIALKLITVPIALWLIDRYGENELERRFLKLIIIILGVGIGTRNVLAIGVFG